MGTIEERVKPVHIKRKRERKHATPKDEDDTITDPRFVAAETDPRFGRVPKRAKKAVVDKRFKQKLKENHGFRVSDTPVDRFGRPKEAQHLHESLRDFVVEDEESDSDSDDDIDDVDRPVTISRLDNESDSDDSDDSDDGDVAEFMAEQDVEEVEDIPRGKATHRLAVIGLDWSTTRAVDIYACLDSFCPSGKSVKSVDVHPSKFGLERLAAEAKFGPQVLAKQDMKVVEDANKQNLVASSGKAPNSDDKDLEQESGGDLSESDDEDVEEMHRKEQAALRRYEEERLKYYYAIVEFSDVKAADAVYEQCDGAEYAQSGRAFDLRFVPDEMKIETTPRDRAESLPDGYVPPNVVPSSLNNSTVKLSWDADDPDRVILKKKAIGKQQLDEENLKAYLGSASEDEEMKESALEIENKRNLLLNSTGKEGEEEADMGMEITFEPGMLEKAEEIVKRKKEKDEKNSETHWEARLRRLQERKTEKRKQRKERREAFKAQGDAASGGEGENVDEVAKNVNSSGFSDPFFSQERRKSEDAELRNRSKRRASNRKKASLGEGEINSLNDAKEEARNRAELELLVMDDATRRAKKIGSMRDMLVAAESDDEDDRGKSRSEKKSGRRRGRKDKTENDNASAPSTMDIKDPRFQGLFHSHLFALDPTHPKFKDNETTQRILKEKMRRTKQNTDTQSRPNHDTDGVPSEAFRKQDAEQSDTANSELRQLAARLKARSKTSGRKNRKR